MIGKNAEKAIKAWLKKLTGVIAWSWWWVTAPTWIGILVFGLIAIGVIALKMAKKI